MKRSVPAAQEMSDNEVVDKDLPTVPEVQVEDPHYKVRDGMRDAQGNPDFIIGQLAIVNKGERDGKTLYDIVFFTHDGTEKGRLHTVEL